MRTVFALFLIVLLLIPLPAFGEIQTITHTIKQIFGGSQSADDARISAITKAKREALEMAGTYIQCTTVVKNAQVDMDEIIALTAGVVKTEVISHKNYHTDEAFGIEVTVRVVVDTAVLEKRLKKVLEDRTHFEQLKQARVREKELLAKIALLEEENRKIGKSKQKMANLKKEFRNASEEMTALDFWNKSISLWVDGKYSDPEKAIKYLNKAIRLKPDFAEAYLSRGLYYFNREQYRQAIKEDDEAIRLKPNNAFAYVLRGFAYCGLVQHQRAIKDYDEAIRLKPDEALIYSIRGDAYAYLGQYQQSIKDYSNSIHLKPDNAKAYYDRGLAYYKLGQNQQAIENFNEAIRLKPDEAVAYGNRGNAYVETGKHQQAIEDFNKVIHLEPDNATAYYNRGRTYVLIGQYQRAIDDCNDAIRLLPDYTNAYSIRGAAYFGLAQFQRAINDYSEAIRLQRDDAKTYVKRGIAYDKLRQYQQAIKDYDEAIRLKPDLMEAYYLRGVDYLQQGNKKFGCLDAKKACELGECYLLKFAKGRGDCSIEIARDSRFIAYENGTVIDTKNGLMWAAKDNGRDINWQGARSYCENYRGGGYTDWRMPTWKELASLYDKSKTYMNDCGYVAHLTGLIHISCAPWASERNGSEAVAFFFIDGSREWLPTSSSLGSRALPVRSVK